MTAQNADNGKTNGGLGGQDSNLEGLPDATGRDPVGDRRVCRFHHYAQTLEGS